MAKELPTIKSADGIAAHDWHDRPAICVKEDWTDEDGKVSSPRQRCKDAKQAEEFFARYA